FEMETEVAISKVSVAAFTQLWRQVTCRGHTWALSYGKCVSAAASGREELRRGACAKEFEDLKQCMIMAAKGKNK
uniref:Uncharacterized protein n=1 Tax=Xenopus tropicalis TaxID=8364 RepID=A0A6I8Q429_XENTR